MNITLIQILITSLTLLITVFAEKLLIPALRARAKQPIYAEGPSWHLKKLGTPTMGGLGFLAASSLSLISVFLYLFLSGERTKAASIIIILAFCILNSAIGIIDDISKIAKRENQGLTPSQKLFLQSMTVVAFLFVRYALVDRSTSVEFSFGTVELGYFYYILAGLALLATVNCANLTDGIDGLASSVAFAAGISLMYICSSVGSEVGYVGAAISGGALGFLFFNIHPAKIFMGDTGSLFFGAAIGASAVMLGNPLLLLLIASVYLIEGISVIVQVAFYKMTGKRIFKMAPLHHHLEKCGFNENKIVICAVLLTLISSALAFALYY